MYRQLLILLVLPTAAWPQTSYDRISAREARLRPERLDRLRDDLAARNTRALIIVRHGKIAYEWYAPGVSAATRHGSASLAKAVVGGMSLLLTMADGRISADDRAASFIPAWREDQKKNIITIRHLATHSSGLEDAEQDGLPHEKLPGWKGAFWRREPDPFSIAIHHSPVLYDPGTRYHYSNPGMAALAYAVTAAARTDLDALLRNRLMEPLGVPEPDWSIGYGRAYEVDGLRLYANWGGGSFTPRAVARVAELMMAGGRWKGKPVVRGNAVMRALAYAGTPLPDRSGGHPAPASGLAWYTNFDGVWEKVPRDAFAGAGAGHQVLLAIPSLELILVRNGGDLRGTQTRDHFWTPMERELFNPLMEAVESDPPYPQSQVIREVRFAPVSSIRCEAVDSDNWPVTWADDGDLYTSYGDGWGFDPRIEKKLSMGFARISGGPEDFRGVNLRSESGERPGDGARGAKASGMLMVDGVLYMWVRNTGNAQLVYSRDQGRTWEWGFKLTTSFGSPAFLNFGKNYAGARDDYVYSYSQDGPSAYESNDRIVMLRAHRKRMLDPAGYEYFERLDSSGKPVWTKEVARRGGVFQFLARIQRVDAVYNSGLKRYLLAAGYNHSGGWGIYEAPEPWGPWSTAFHTEAWGLGGTHGYRLPSKWISAGGRTMWLIFSGVRLPSVNYDAFCVQRMTLE